MDAWSAMQNPEEPDTDLWKPAAPCAAANALDTAMFDEELKAYMLRWDTFANNKSKLFEVVFGQCSAALKAKLKGRKDWDDIHDECTLVKLLESINV